MAQTGVRHCDELMLRWLLIPDGDRLETDSSWLAPFRRRSQPAMLKVFKPTSDERGSAEVLRYFGGVGAVTVPFGTAPLAVGRLVTEERPEHPPLKSLQELEANRIWRRRGRRRVLSHLCL